MQKNFSIIVACDNEFGIGYKNDIPWKGLIPEDMKYFKKITSQNYSNSSNITKDFPKNVVVMGRKTWVSIGRKPLKNRINVILSKDLKDIPELTSAKTKSIQEILSKKQILLFNNIDSCIKELQTLQTGKIFIIGGNSIYTQFLNRSNLIDNVYVTRIYKKFNCDVFFPMSIITNKTVFKRDNTYLEDKLFSNNLKSKIDYKFEKYVNKNVNPGEFQYLELISEIMKNGFYKMDRTGTGTYSKIGCTMKFDLRDGRFPLLTTKKTFMKGIIEELLWFIKGDTDSKNLSKKGVKIWDANGSREFLDKGGFTEREIGDLGPIYGFQWRHFGAKYIDCNSDYSKKGVDQLKSCIETIKKNPQSRRIIMSAWNPIDISKMALPPCHILCQFFVVKKEFLTCLMYQRSADMGLGVPFNIASYSLLTYLVAQVCNLKPLEFVHVLGDAHVYKNHIDALKIQIERIPRKFPTIKINKNVKKIDEFKFEDISIVGYNPYPSIKMKMAL